MVFLAWFFVPQAFGLLGFGLTLGYRKLRKRPLGLYDLIRRLVGSLSAAMAVGLLLALIMYLAFPRLGFLPSMGAFLFLTFIAYFADPLTLFLDIENPARRGKVILTGALSLFFVLEVFAFNAKAYAQGDMRLLSSGDS